MKNVDWKFKPGFESLWPSDGFWYYITRSGCIRPEDILSDPDQIQLVKGAVELLESFEAALQDT